MFMAVVMRGVKCGGDGGGYRNARRGKSHCLAQPRSALRVRRLLPRVLLGLNDPDDGTPRRWAAWRGTTEYEALAYVRISTQYVNLQHFARCSLAILDDYHSQHLHGDRKLRPKSTSPCYSRRLWRRKHITRVTAG